LVVRVKLWVAAVPTPLLAVNVMGNVPAEPEAVPLRVPVPFPLSLNVTPAGRVPDSVSDGAGAPVVVTVKLPALPTVNVALFALMIVGELCREYVAVAVALVENPVAVAIAWTVVVVVTLKGTVYCCVVPCPGDGALPSVV
jgi:hypothetical protein